MRQAKFTWFKGGKLNAAGEISFKIRWMNESKQLLKNVPFSTVNCVDRHAADNPDRVALIWEKDEPGQQEYITYKLVKCSAVKLLNLNLSCVISYLAFTPPQRSVVDGEPDRQPPSAQRSHQGCRRLHLHVR